MICRRCCGSERLLHIACPEDCPHLQAHEAFQLARQGERYRDAWSEAVRGASEGDVRALGVLERCVVHAVTRHPSSGDAETLAALEDLHRRLSPIEIVSGSPPDLVRAMQSAVDEAAGAVTREAIRDAISRLSRIGASLEEGASSRGFLRGLTAWVLARSTLSTDRPRSELIVTPEDLRRDQ